jgi:hypothetical protein
MNSGITLAKIAVLSVLLAVFLGAIPAMDLMRRYGIWPLDDAEVPVTAMTVTPAPVKVLPRAPQKLTKPRRASNASGNVSKKRGSNAFETYQVPAGTVLMGLLRAPLDSGRTRVDAPVRALLRSTLRQEGMELIPAASIVYGKVIDVIPASRMQPRGRIVVAFFFIEHGVTGTRIAIAARPLVLEPIDVAGGSVLRTADVRVNAGELLPISLTEPLVVRLPK